MNQVEDLIVPFDGLAKEIETRNSVVRTRTESHFLSAKKCQPFPS